MLRTALIVFLFALPVSARPTVARLLCQELVFQIDSRLSDEQAVAEWSGFADRLEKGALRVGFPAETDRVQRCILLNQEDGERGDFLLEGRRLLHDLALQNSHAEREVAATPVLGSVNLPGFGEVILNAMTRKVEASPGDRLNQRSKHYDALWTEFVEQLRKTMTVRRDTLKMKFSGR